MYVSSCWGLNCCANTSISLLFNWISLTLKLMETSYGDLSDISLWRCLIPGPRDVGMKHCGSMVRKSMLTGYLARVYMPASHVKAPQCRSISIYDLSMISYCLLATNVCFPCCLITSSPEATFLTSMLMNS